MVRNWFLGAIVLGGIVAANVAACGSTTTTPHSNLGAGGNGGDDFSVVGPTGPTVSSVGSGVGGFKATTGVANGGANMGSANGGGDVRGSGGFSGSVGFGGAFESVVTVTSPAASSGTGLGNACFMCSENTCAAQCAGDENCLAWLACVSQCDSSACVTTCSTTAGGTPPTIGTLMTCLCMDCGTECAAISPCTPVCKAGHLFPETPGTNTVFCPYTNPKAACVHGTEHCCEQPSVLGTCESLATPCPPGNLDWACGDPAIDCPGQVCCTNFGAQIEFASSPACQSTENNVASTACANTCLSTQFQICTSNAQCPAQQNCWPFSAMGNGLGACH